MKREFTLLTALLLTPLATLRPNRALPELSVFGKLRVGSFQPLESHGAMISNVWD